MKVYLDYSATTPLKSPIKKAIKENFDHFGNPSSIHEWGRIARGLVDDARNSLAGFLNCEAQEIVFTSGGTEADNLAIKGIIDLVNGQRSAVNSLPHIITSRIEHHAVLNTCKNLEKKGLAEVTYLKPNRDGLVELNDVQEAIKKNTILVSIMYVNNEIGTVQPIREIGKIIEKENKLRITNNELRIYFHTDAVQATEYQDMNVSYLHVDLLTLSGHKIGTPKGIGVLYVKKGTPLAPIIHGGEQELGLRAGTENTLGMIALGRAVELLKNKKYQSRIIKLRNYFIDTIIKEIPAVELNGSKELRSPNNTNFYFKYIEGESILLNLDLAGIAASSGSACTSQSLEPSHVIMAVYNQAERAHGSIRFSLGQETTQKQIDYTISKLKEIVSRLRKMSPLTPNNLKDKNE